MGSLSVTGIKVLVSIPFDLSFPLLYFLKKYILTENDIPNCSVQKKKKKKRQLLFNTNNQNIHFMSH